MEHLNILLNFLVILAVVLIAIPDDAGGKQILNYDDEAPAYPWERIVYREQLPRPLKREEELLDAANRSMGDAMAEVNPNKEGKRIFGFDEKNSELKNYGKHSELSGVRVVYGRVSEPVIVVASYPEPNQ